MSIKLYLSLDGVLAVWTGSRTAYSPVLVNLRGDLNVGNPFPLRINHYVIYHRSTDSNQRSRRTSSQRYRKRGVLAGMHFWSLGYSAYHPLRRQCITYTHRRRNTELQPRRTRLDA